MKKQVLFLAMMLLGIASATATTAGDAVLNGEDLNTLRYRFTQPIMFVERGIEFLIFPDGSFDFNTETLSTTQGHYYYRRNRRGANQTFGAPGVVYDYGNRGVLIQHDRLGRVRRIGNVFINYDRQGRIKRAGTVYMRYRSGQLKQVGGLHLLYNRYGEVVGTRGYVNYSNQGSGWLGITDTTVGGFDNYHFNDNELDWDDDFYYYRKNGKVEKQKKNITIRK
ncbi:hypothetical protein [Winogradskyella sp.]|uniref:hypothetical protein n=1 Tax=Winogradskyella sp. TaxID=1883156 RepID=UPI0035190460